MYREVLTFWFEEIEPKQWWAVEPTFDALIESRFGELLQRTARCELHEWRSQPKGRLAEIIVLDQFSRNVFRNTPQAFTQDPMALALAQEAVAAGVHRSLSPIENCFLLMPYMHSESARIHVEAEALFRQFAPDDNYQFELQHKAIVDRFKRYPHRNAILGRASTPEEIEFLKQPGSGF